MFNIPRLTRLLITAPLALAFAAPAAAQIEVLRQRDGQYIEGLRKYEMSDLLKHFSEVEKPEKEEDELALKMALNEFVARDLLKRSNAAFAQEDIDQGTKLFTQSRETFEQVLDAQLQLISKFPKDERMPIWQTELANKIIFNLLPTYYQDAPWVYEFGNPTPEQKAAYEKWMVEALVATSNAKFSLDRLNRRVGAEPDLRPKLDAMGIWFTLNDYLKLNTPFMLAHASHAVSLMPATVDYYAKGEMVPGQKSEVKGERERLRGQVVSSLTGAMNVPGVKEQAMLLTGQALVRSSDDADIDEGVDSYLDPILGNLGAPPYQHYIASLSKAIGRWNVGEEETAIDILKGIKDSALVRQDGTTFTRMLAADLMFRLLMEKTKDKAPRKKAELTAKAYELAYVPLINIENDDRYRTILFTRWAKQADQVEDVTTLPPAVRMGIGEQLTQQGSAAAQTLVADRRAQPPGIPADEAKLEARRKQVVALLERASEFNTTLIGEDAEKGPVLARALFNEAMCQYFLGDIAEVFAEKKGEKMPPWQNRFKCVVLWLSVAKLVPDAPQVELSLKYAMSLALPYDMAYNKDAVNKNTQLIRDTYKEIFEIMVKKFAQDDVVHNNRLYAGFHLYEKQGKFAEAVAIYRDLPSRHPDYYEARRQMIYVMQRLFRKQDNERLFLSASKPAKAPVGAPAEAVAKANQAIADWELKLQTLNEDITRVREEIVKDAELIILDAEDELDGGGGDPGRLFKAATALGAAKVVLAGMESDAGNFDQALKLLEGFEKQFAENGKYVEMAKANPNVPDTSEAKQAAAARAEETMRSLIQSAQEQRILTLLSAGKTDEMTARAREMMDASPSVAKRVVNGVLSRIGTNIEREERLLLELVANAAKADARERIKFQADAAVALGKLLVDWAKGQNFDEAKIVRYKIPLAKSLMLAGRGEDALAIIKPIVNDKQFERNFAVQMIAGKAYLSVYKESKKAEDYNGAAKHLGVIIKYYNLQPVKADDFWEAWLNYMRLFEAAGDEKKASIANSARILLEADPNLGGPEFKDKILDIVDRNGGVER